MNNQEKGNFNQEGEANPEVVGKFQELDQQAKEVAEQLSDANFETTGSEEEQEIVSKLESVAYGILALSGIGAAAIGLYGEVSITEEIGRRSLEGISQVPYAEAVATAMVSIGIVGSGVSAAGFYKLFDSIKRMRRQTPHDVS